VTAVVGGLFAAAFFTTTILASTRASRMIGALPTLAGVMLFGLVLALPIAALTIGDTRPTPAQLPYLLIAGVGNVLGLGSQYIAVRTGKVGVVGALAAAEGAIAAVLSVMAGERLGPVSASSSRRSGVTPTAATRGRPRARSCSAVWPAWPSAPASMPRGGSARTSQRVGRSSHPVSSA
jgi:uncharacterized membrane protein